MSTRIRGAFDITLSPQDDGGHAVGRMRLDKRYHGDLDATSEGQMLAIRSAVDGSAGYVAMERVTGTLQGKTGSFALQHTGSMNRGTPSLSVSVVPDSGTDALTGLSGTMNIVIENRAHFYEFEFELPAAS
jgi:hypothetical protein